MSSHRSRDASPQPEETFKAPGAFPSSPAPNSEPEYGIISAPQSLSLAVKARRSEYIRKKTIKIKVGTWNIAAVRGAEMDIGAWFVEGKGVIGLDKTFSASSSGNGKENIESVVGQEGRHTRKTATVPRNDMPAVLGGEEIGLYVLGLQEVVDITSASETLRPFADPLPAKKWKAALKLALPQGYELIAEQQLSGLLLLVYASSGLVPSIGSVSTTSVGTGLMGYMGNKGAVCARIVLGETTRLVFINCHLAAGSDRAALDRRNWDVGQILSRVRFHPMSDDDDEVVGEFGDAIGDEDFGFWLGDLNYRLDDIPPEDVRRLLLLHTRNEYDLNNKSKRKIDGELGYVSADQDLSSTDPSQASDHQHDSDDLSDDEVEGLPLNPESDPASLHTTLKSLLSHDQLRIQQKNHKAFHDGWREGDIDFLPTYKYDIGSVGMFDSGEKKRGPSWCDRILYRTRQDRIEAQRRRAEEDESKKRDDEMKKRGLDNADEDVIFDSDPGTPGFPGTPGYAPGDDYDEEEDAAAESELEPGRHGIDEAISLEHYGSHQRVLSSDHKPLDAVFSITYEAVIPQLKAKVHQEVARELDKQENEGRPVVTVVVDNQPGASTDSADASTEQPEVTGINFGEVRYGVHKSTGLTVANTGGVMATFSFVDRPLVEGQKSGIAPAWLCLQIEGDPDNANLNPNALQEYTLYPGETKYVHLYVEVQEFKLVRRLNDGKVRLDDVLVLRVKEGRDYFLPVSGLWMQSSFARSLDELVSVPEGGIRQMQAIDEESATNEPDHDAGHESVKRQRLSAPRELFELTEIVQDLAQRAVAEWEMTHANDASTPPWKQSHGDGWPFDLQTWTMNTSQERSELLASAREALDTGDTLCSLFPEKISTLHRLEVLAETLLTFLGSLQDGIIASEIWAQLDSHMNTAGKSASSDADPQSWILEILSATPLHNVSFTFITFMLCRIANEIAPVSSSSTSDLPQSPRLSSSSTRSSTSESQQHRILPAAISTSPTSPHTRLQTSILTSFRRSRARNNTSTSSEEPTSVPEDLARRQVVEQAYADIFAEVMIRRPPSMKDRKATKEKMRRIILPFIGNV